ncbi:DNA starvation/stationary phase protection protein Dps [Pseudaestuariivita rosea]|uniref:DNA starvation/stationary phase protection protein Dps n=1 Tax=Pseudaestuariivita rosea TaxID=2763263 RepID=UPI001ABB1CC8|nr:DNA starvation/stationary phase protection protein Dps [Pseudaestuariivita rosea]
MTPTCNHLDENVRARTVSILRALTLALDLALRSKQSHWNIKGPGFIALHQMLDDLTGQMHDAADTMAERLVALGGFAEGTAQHIHENACIGSELGHRTGQADVLTALTQGYATFSQSLIGQIDETAQIGDPTSSDVLTEVSRTVDKSLWFLEAHLPSDKLARSVLSEQTALAGQ